MRTTSTSKSSLRTPLQINRETTAPTGLESPLKSDSLKETNRCAFQQKQFVEIFTLKGHNLLLLIAFLILLPLAISVGEDDEPIMILKRSPKKAEKVEPVDTTKQPLTEKIAKTKKEIDQLVATSGKCTEDRDCVALPIGEKPCGGPERYIVYSKRSPKSSEISKLAAAYLTHRKTENSSSIDMSDCQFITAPKIECNSKKSCVAMNN